jgi:HK97 family phage prohead protease
MNHAYSLLTVKAANDGPDGMTIEGIASTPETDRVGDIVEPLGAKFSIPMPLLMNHDSKQVVGRVEFAKATPTGIPFRAFLPYVKEEGRLKDRIDEAVHTLKYGLVGAVSIGFNALAGGIEYIKGGGIRYKSWEWLELSLVPIPAHPAARITGVKAIDAALARAATGAAASPVAPSPAARLALPPKSPKESRMSHETIRRMESERVAKMAAAKSIMDKALNDGRTPDAEEQQGYDSMLSEVKGIDATLDRLREFEKLDEKAANVVPVVSRPAASVASITHVKNNDDIPGLGLARIARCIYEAKGSRHVAAQIAAEMYKDDQRVANHFKAVVVAGSTVSGTWGADLMTTDGGPFAEFLEYLRPQTIIGRIPGLSTVPFYAPVGIQTGAGAGYWVGEGKAKPLTAFDYDKTSLPPLTAANIVVLTKKLFKYSGVNADMHIRDQLSQALIGRIDTDFIDPTKTASSGISPASITNGVTAPNSAGNTADDVRTDIATLMAALSKPIRNLVFITDTTTAIALSLMTNGLGQPEFPGVTMAGGTLMPGVPLVVSDYVPSVTAGSLLIAIKASEILVADEGGFSIDLSEDATLQMADNPDGSSVATVAGTAPFVSMFQTNGVAFRCERDINWAAARSGGVALVDTVNYGV